MSYREIAMRVWGVLMLVPLGVCVTSGALLLMWIIATIPSSNDAVANFLGWTAVYALGTTAATTFLGMGVWLLVAPFLSADK